jgi:hypothetical protein
MESFLSKTVEDMKANMKTIINKEWANSSGPTEENILENGLKGNNTAKVFS